MIDRDGDSTKPDMVAKRVVAMIDASDDWQEKVNIILVHLKAARAEALEDAIHAQPCTAADPNENAYALGEFVGVMAFVKSIRALAQSAEPMGGQNAYSEVPITPAQSAAPDAQ
jgi:hypothetical protein